MLKKSIKTIFLPLLNIFFVIALIFALLGSYISPVNLIFPLYFVLAFPLLVIVNLVFVVLWILLKKWYFIVSLVLLLLSVNNIRNSFAINIWSNKTTVSDRKLKIVSFNTHSNGGIVKSLPGKMNGVFKFLLQEKPDIICIQEYLVTTNTALLTQNEVDSLLKDYPYKVVNFRTDTIYSKTGLVVYSKYPIINNKKIVFESVFNEALFVDIVIKKDTIRLFSNHLESNKILGNDFVLVDNLANNINHENVVQTTDTFAKRLSEAFPIRAIQADMVHEEIKKSPYNVIVCGDFNDVPNSYTYTKIKDDLNDAFVEAGNGMGWTFNSSIFKNRIDFIFYDNKFEVVDFNIWNTHASDHYALSCVLKIL